MSNKSRYLLACTISFAIGTLLSNYGKQDIYVWFWLLGLILLVLFVFWDKKLVRLLSFSNIFLLIGYIYPFILKRETLLYLPPNFIVYQWLETARIAYIGALSQALPEPQSSLASGLVIGTKSGFSAGLKESFINTGTIHLVAVSGFNITIVIKIFSDYLRYFGRKPAFYIGTFAIVAFIILVGGQASVVRAGIMGWLFLLARFVYRIPNVRNALFFTGLLMIVQEPAILTKDIGFQLSFISMLGLIYISPLIALLWDKFEKVKIIPKLIFNALKESIAAQFAVNLLILGHFGRLSLIAILPNILIVPIIPIPMILGIVIGALALVFHTSIGFVASPLDMILKYILSVINIFNKVPYASVYFGKLNWWYVFGGYLIMILFIRYLYKKIYATK